MPSIVNTGVINVNTPQQNANVMIGEMVITGQDANMKFNVALGGTFGFFNVVGGNVNTMLDNLEFADGNIFDQDLKPDIGIGNI